ncbi:hypothetical protein GN244_ATG18317 [Phytophthora infestans]|uniref:Uncharacterized protein n=1 Tax=Phytophthora infestans TaxID=4787 RepID=A0A833SLI6_PHYIN|nr:hypothetical protein GN244_ATG18317 [Phytophthora infestans]KAF4134151.1 hypothetical protein GN958_ATG16626 [Phytophthora infestans]
MVENLANWNIKNPAKAKGKQLVRPKEMSCGGGDRIGAEGAVDDTISEAVYRTVHNDIISVPDITSNMSNRDRISNIGVNLYCNCDNVSIICSHIWWCDLIAFSISPNVW